MMFESLPNELLLDLFEYFSTIDLFQSFYELNNRFTKLIYVHFQNHTVNFQSISKSNFDVLCQKYLPSITNYISSLRFSDDDNTPQQIDLFFFYGLSFRQFTHLKSLTIHQFNSFHYLSTILEQLINLTNLNYLKITRYDIKYNENFDVDLIHLIEYLPKLTFCYLDISYDNEHSCQVLSMKSSSLKYLSLPYLNCNINQMIYLIRNLLNLVCLKIVIVGQSSTSHISMIEFLSIKKLNITFYGTVQSLNNLLQTMPNLEEFKIDIEPIFINGYQWETMIETYLSHLIKFQFKTNIMISSEKNKEDEIDRILNSFRSQFWIQKHQWFVQCNWIPNEYSRTVLIYTLPYAFEDFFFAGHVQMKSTVTKEIHHWSFNSIKNLYYGYISYKNLPLPQIHFDNIRHLDITIPFDQLFHSLVSSLEQLDSLKIDSYDHMNTDNIQSNLRLLCQQASQLRSLKLFSSFTQHNFLFNIDHSTIRELNLQGPDIVYNQEQCDKLAYSSLGQQCQILFITVAKRTNIIDLVNNMKHLRSLIVRCIEENSIQTDDENLIEWLRQQLPITCSISKSKEVHNNIRLWIR